MAKVKHPKRKALEAQLANSDQQRILAEKERDHYADCRDAALAERDTWIRRANAAEREALDLAALAENERASLNLASDAFARTVLRAAGVNGNGDLEKVRRLCRGWLDNG